MSKKKNKDSGYNCENPTRSSIVKSYGGMKGFMDSYGLKIHDLDDVNEANAIIDAMRDNRCLDEEEQLSQYSISDIDELYYIEENDINQPQLCYDDENADYNEEDREYSSNGSTEYLHIGGLHIVDDDYCNDSGGNSESASHNDNIEEIYDYFEHDEGCYDDNYEGEGDY